MKNGLLIGILMCLNVMALGQKCTALGQNPRTAFPVCGTQTFSQIQVPICDNGRVPGPCDADSVTGKNPYWYKFTCFTAGTLGFTITPNTISDDYDWQLFDITGKDPDDVYTNRSLFVACGWSGEGGLTGASSAGTSLEVCGGMGKPLWSKMPTLKKDHEYLLLISHFTDSQSGYKIDFSGGTASITDTTTPAAKHAIGSCNGDQIGIKLNKKLRCVSLAADGSDFIMPNGEANVIGAVAYSCNTGFDMDSVIVLLDRILPPADYSVAIKTGTDNNTLFDICNTPLDPVTINFTIHQDVTAAFTHTIVEGCKIDKVTLSHPGGDGVNYWRWDSELTSYAQNTSFAYSTPGSKTINLIVSNGYCYDTAQTTFTVQQKLQSIFDAPEIICVKDHAVFTNKSLGTIDHYNWDLGETGSFSVLQTPEPHRYNYLKGEIVYTVKLRISDNKGCEDVSQKNIIVASNCIIAVPTGFTPNSDGKNDYLYPSNAFDAENLLFRVYNRFGQLIHESRNWRNKWDGTFKGHPQPGGAYVWTLSYTYRLTGRPYNLKGTTILIR